MRFDPAVCPRCGGAPDEITETLFAYATLAGGDREGAHHYAGDSELDWDSQVPTMQDGKVEVRCGGCRERWLARLVRTDPRDPVYGRCVEDARVDFGPGDTELGQQAMRH